MITARSPLDPHWRARLLEIQDLLFAAHDAEELARPLLLLVAVLHDEWQSRDQAAALTLLSEAYELLTNPETRIDLRDWARAAAPLVKAAR